MIFWEWPDLYGNKHEGVRARYSKTLGPGLSDLGGKNKGRSTAGSWVCSGTQGIVDTGCTWEGGGRVGCWCLGDPETHR